MPQLGVSVNGRYDEHRARPVDAYGRRVRHVAGVEPAVETKPFLDPLFLKIAAGLAIIAAIAMAVALWRLFTFPH